MKKITSIALLSISIYASAVDPSLIKWDSTEGISRLERSKYKVDFFKLASNFVGQPDKFVCGTTAGAIVLNALRLNKEKASVLPLTSFDNKYKKHLKPKWEPRFNRYTPINFLNLKTNKVKTRMQIYGGPIKGKRDAGLQIRQLHNIFLVHNVASKLKVVTNKLDKQKLKQELILNLQTEDDYIIVNYSRKVVGQNGGGHFSPLAAYDKVSDSFLVLDVNPNRDTWAWIKSNVLFAAMGTFDTIENRGYLLLSDSPSK